jgi:HEAT repeat protein
MAAWALESGRAGRGGEALLRALARDDADQVRATAAWALGNGDDGSPAVIAALDRALGDRAERVRERAAWAIGSLEPATAPNALFRTALSDPSASVRRVAAWALSEIRDPRASDALLARLEQEPQEEVLKVVARALLLTEPQSPDAVNRLVRSPNAEIRAWAVATAGGVTSPTWPWPWPWPDPRPSP